MLNTPLCITVVITVEPPPRMLVVYTLVVVMVDQTPFAVRQVGGKADAGKGEGDVEVGITVLDEEDDEVELDGRGDKEVWEEDEIDVVDVVDEKGDDAMGEKGDDVLEAKEDEEDGKKLVLVMKVAEIESREEEMEALGVAGVDGKPLKT